MLVSIGQENVPNIFTPEFTIKRQEQFLLEKVLLLVNSKYVALLFRLSTERERFNIFKSVAVDFHIIHYSFVTMF